jgi:hypothetical protein
MAPYLNAGQARDRLSSRFGITADPKDGDLDAASDELDARGPFIGEKYAPSTQARAFPRDVTVLGDTAGVVPERVLDWVALRAYQLSIEDVPRSLKKLSWTTSSSSPGRRGAGQIGC